MSDRLWIQLSYGSARFDASPVPPSTQRLWTTGRIFSLVLVAIMTSGLVPAIARAQRSSERLLLSADLHETAEGDVLELRFSQPLRFVRASPGSPAALILIEVQVIGVARAEDDLPSRTEVIQPGARDGRSPVLEIAVTPNGSPTQRVLEVRLRSKRAYEVRQGSDVQRLQVVLPARRSGAGSKGQAEAAALLAQANEALGRGDTARAIQLYSRVLSLGAIDLHPEALERLALARERNGQRAQAKGEYESFLKRFPDHERAPIIRQRLQALMTSDRSPTREDPTQMPTEIARPPSDSLRTDVHGSLLASYSRAEGWLEGLDSQVYDSSAYADFQLRGRMRTPRYEVEASGAGRTRVDFQDVDLGSDTRLSSALLEASERGTGFWGNLGRQRGDGGVIGRFDGGRIGYRPTDRMEFQLIGGFPLETYSSDAFNTDRYQVGAAGEVLDLFSLADVEVYGNYQNDSGLTYRTAVGAEIRHLSRGRSIVLSFDYDAFFQALNIATLLADFQVLENTSVNALIEYRKSPILTLGNALIGQPVNSLRELEDLFSSSDLKRLAEDRSADATQFTIGARHEFDRRFELSGNVTASQISGTPSSGGVPKTRSTGYALTYYVQAGSQGLLMDRDYTTLALRIYDADAYDDFLLQLNGRYPILRSVRLNPILQLLFRDGDSDFVRLTPRLRADYRYRQVVFDVDVAFDWIRGTGGIDRPEEYGYSLLVGVRWDF